MITGTAIEVTQTAIDTKQMQQIYEITVSMDTVSKAILYVLCIVAGCVIGYVIASSY